MKLAEWVKRGNTSSGMAALGNAIIAIVKGIVAAISGNGTMFATAMHSFADMINQTFVFTGSVLSERKPSKKFPTGFGRVINIVCMIAVIVVTLMAYETIKSGWKAFMHPQASSDLVLNIVVILGAALVDGYVFVKTIREIKREANTEQIGNSLIVAFKQAKKAAPATRLVFYEDFVATIGALIAVFGIVLGRFIPQAEGLASMLIGCLMVFVAFRVGFDNMVGLIGVAAPAEVEQTIARGLLQHSSVVDIFGMRVLQEGRAYHVEVTVELAKGLTLAEADDIKFELEDALLHSDNITDVRLGIIEDNDETNWDQDI